MRYAIDKRTKLLLSLSAGALVLLLALLAALFLAPYSSGEAAPEAEAAANGAAPPPAVAPPPAASSQQGNEPRAPSGAAAQASVSGQTSANAAAVVYTLQLGAFENPDNAGRRLEQVRTIVDELGLDAETVAVRQQIQAIRLLSSDACESARELTRALGEHCIDYFVIRTHCAPEVSGLPPSPAGKIACRPR